MTRFTLGVVLFGLTSNLVAGPNIETEKSPSTILQVTGETYNKEISDSSVPVVVEYANLGCPHCRRAAGAFKEVAEELKGKVKFCFVDIAGEEKLFLAASLQMIPTFVFLTRGKSKGKLKEVHRIEGWPDDVEIGRQELRQVIEEYFFRLDAKAPSATASNKSKKTPNLGCAAADPAVPCPR